MKTVSRFYLDKFITMQYGIGNENNLTHTHVRTYTHHKHTVFMIKLRMGGCQFSWSIRQTLTPNIIETCCSLYQLSVFCTPIAVDQHTWHLRTVKRDSMHETNLETDTTKRELFARTISILIRLSHNDILYEANIYNLVSFRIRQISSQFRICGSNFS